MFQNLSIPVPKELLNFGTTALENSSSTTNESLPHLSQLNEAIQVLETSLSNIGVLHLGGVEGAGLTTILGIVASSGLMIRGIFVYYLANYAPKNRPINKLMMLDQVRNIKPSFQPLLSGYLQICCMIQSFLSKSAILSVISWLKDAKNFQFVTQGAIYCWPNLTNS